MAENKISLTEFEELSLPLFKSIIFMIDKPSHEKDLIKKQQTLNTLKQLIGDVTSIGTLNSKEDKIKMINFLEKIDLQIELIDLKLGKLKPSDLKAAGIRLGRKAQSGF
ncbi:hypothetical protein [Algoriphagus sp.]|uniref:hypothetical protein n=1 Tax=Algoriphagus sp. TaxID=1872435 RepID=UPI00391C4E98